MPAPLLEEAGTSSDLTNAEKIVVDDTVHIDKDHATDIIRIEMHNDMKAPIVFNNSAHSPKKRFHVRPNGSVHTAGNERHRGGPAAARRPGDSRDAV